MQILLRFLISLPNRSITNGIMLRAEQAIPSVVHAQPTWRFRYNGSAARGRIIAAARLREKTEDVRAEAENIPYASVR